MYSTQLYFSKYLSQRATTSLSRLLCCKLMAITFFRIPEVGVAISSAVSLQGEEKEEFYEIMQRSGYPIPTSEPSKQSHRLLASFPQLFQWPQFHFTLQKAPKGKNLRHLLENAPQEWVSMVSHRDGLFLIFFNEWLLHVMSNTSIYIDFHLVPAYTVMGQAFLHTFFTRPSSKMLLDTSSTLLLSDLSLINIFIWRTFSVTSIFSTPAVLGKNNLI